jgi:hypothetical protein
LQSLQEEQERVAELLERVRDAQKSEGLHLQTALSELTSLGKDTVREQRESRERERTERG